MPAFLRTLAFALLALPHTALFGGLVALAYPLPAGFRHTLIATWYHVTLALCSTLLGLRYCLHGRENIPEGACIVLSKHESAWETIALQQIFPPAIFVMKKSLIMIPFLGWGLASARMISIDRASGKEALRQVVDQGRERLAKGFRVVVFPEGTRVPPGETRRFKIGGAHLAVATGVPAVPVAHNAGDFWDKRRFSIRPGIITVSIGTAIDPAGRNENEVNALAEQWIASEMQRIAAHRYTRKTGNATDALAA